MDNNSIYTTFMTDKDWIDKGKADAWSGKPRDSPEHDPKASSMYDLGYCEGEIRRSPTNKRSFVSPKIIAMD